MTASYVVYILRTDRDTLYIGQTQDLPARLDRHRRHAGGAKYLAYFKSFKLVYTEEFKSRSSALRREAELKKLTRSQKESLIG